jgi:NAD(P)H dehydrogenase (quinone)
VALARTPAKAADLAVTVRQADYDRPETLEPALRDVDTLLLISSSEVGKRVVQHRNVIEAAKKAVVKRIVYTSLLHADTSPLDLAEEHLATERMVRDSGIAYTILRNGWYTENYTGAIPGALAGGAFLGSAGTGRISSAARADFAKAAVAVLTSDRHEARPTNWRVTWTLSDLAAEISRQRPERSPTRICPRLTTPRFFRCRPTRRPGAGDRRLGCRSLARRCSMTVRRCRY